MFRFTDSEGERDALKVFDCSAGEDLNDLAGETIAQARVLGTNLGIELEGPEGDAVFVRGITDVEAIDFHDHRIAVA